MKKLMYGALFLAAVGIGVVGCRKESLEKNDNLSSISKNLSSGISIKNGMLQFRDVEHVKNTISALNDSYLKHEDDFLTSYPNKNGEQLMEIEENISFKDFLPFEQFESNLKFNSLRLKIQNEYKIYENSGKDDNSDPENHFIIEYAVQTVLNQYEEIMIGNVIYKFYNDGYIKITDGNFNTLISIRANKNLIHSLNNVIIEGNEGVFNNKNELCVGHRSIGNKYTSGARRIKWRVAIQTFPWSRYVIAESKNFIKKNNKWKKFRCHTKCRVWGDISDYETLEDGTKVANCDKTLRFNEENGAFSDKLNTKSWQHKIFVSTKTKTNWVKGWHYSYIGAATEYNSTLTFY